MPIKKFSQTVGGKKSVIKKFTPLMIVNNNIENCGAEEEDISNNQNLINGGIDIK